MVVTHDAKVASRLVYAHGGAVLSGTADLYKPHLSLLALNCGLTVFNVDYRQSHLLHTTMNLETVRLPCSVPKVSFQPKPKPPGWPQSRSVPSKQSTSPPC